MNERLITVRKYFHRTQKDFGDVLGVSRDVIASLESGRVPIKTHLSNSSAASSASTKHGCAPAQAPCWMNPSPLSSPVWPRKSSSPRVNRPSSPHLLTCPRRTAPLSCAIWILLLKSSPRPRPILKKKTSIPHLPPTGRLIRRAGWSSSTPHPTAKRPEPHRFWPFMLQFILLCVTMFLNQYRCVPLFRFLRPASASP